MIPGKRKPRIARGFLNWENSLSAVEIDQALPARRINSVSALFVEQGVETMTSCLLTQYLL
jgi:hypothetical protein